MTDEDDRCGDDLAAQQLEELFARHRGAVIRYVRRRAPADGVDDVVAETFLIAWQRLDRVPADAPLPWLLAVARNVIGNQLRGASRRDALSARLRGMSVTKAVDPLDEQQTGPVSEAMARLAEKDREALELIASEGLKPRQAAAVLGMSPSAFRMRVHRAKGRLKRMLEEQGEQQPTGPHRRPLKTKETRA